MSHEVAKHVRYNSKLKALQRTPHQMIVNRLRNLLDRLHSEVAEAPGLPKPADDQVHILRHKWCDTKVTIKCCATTQ